MTSLTVDQIICLLRSYLIATCFTFTGNYYKQMFGTTLGSPISVVVAGLGMENVEERALTMAEVVPRL